MAVKKSFTIYDATRKQSSGSNGVNTTTILSKLKKLTGNSCAKLIHQAIDNIGGVTIFDLSIADKIEVVGIRLFSDGTSEYGIDAVNLHGGIVIMVDELPSGPIMFRFAEPIIGATRYMIAHQILHFDRALEGLAAIADYGGDIEDIKSISDKTEDNRAIPGKSFIGDLNRVNAIMVCSDTGDLGDSPYILIRRDCLADSVYIQPDYPNE